jgi:CRISPR-associated protein Cmr2
VTPLELWRYKVLQTWHDPIHKMAIQGLLAHEDSGLRHLEALTGVRHKRGPFKAPDRLATGADRPVVGGRNSCYVSWRNDPVLSHPLQPVRLQVEWDALPAGRGAKAAATALDSALAEVMRPLALPAGGWDSLPDVRRLLLRLWRLAPEMLRDLGFQAPYLPADSRSPDHSVWDHTRVASAAAYLVEMDGKNRPAGREPWMLALTLGGVQRFLREARKTRDLWTASMIYADLAWAAMHPVVDALGPDAILYPDLRGNPTADRWLLDEVPGAAPEPVRRSGATSYAAMLPNTFVALVPRGGEDSGFPDLEDLVRRCTEAVGERWRALAGAVEEWLVGRAGRGSWQKIWYRQVSGGLGEPRVSWVAVPWLRRMNEATQPALGPALPGRSPDAPVASPHPQLQRREEALSPWLRDRVWVHYEAARLVFWQTHAGYLTEERGFDYPLVHHQLRAALSMRKAAGQPRVMEEPGEKCSLTGREEVLHNGEAGPGPLVTRRREGAREFWKRFDADGLGDERLGSTAVIKRYLVQAREPAFTKTWQSEAEARERGAKEPRVPFPSTAALAAASFLEGLAERAAQPAVAGAIRDFVAAFDRSGLEETVDPRSLPALARAAGGQGMSRLLAIEPEYLFPETLEVLIRRAPESAQTVLEGFRSASAKLRDRATEARIPPPRKLVAVLRMDGDSLSRLILGDPAVMPTTWEDVLHPKATEQVKAKLAATGWPGLLGARRHMGPALHAAISRSLADFAHKMVAWVVEREFSGRLVYAGGDDLLALLPAAEALPAAARLQQLFSAPYVLDTDAHADPWAWRRAAGEPPGATAAARQRFRVPEVVEETGTILLSHRRFEPHADGDPTSPELPEGRAMALYPMLGRGQSLSAGIAIGHYKTPLSLMLRTAGDLLEREAKHRMSRGAVAVTLLSRSGTKVTFAGRWRVDEEPRPAEGREDAVPRVNPRAPDVQVFLRRVMEGFSRASAGSEREVASARPRLAGRMPYKLREQIEKTGAVLLEEREDRARMVRRLVKMESGLSAEQGRHEALLDAASRLVACGLAYADQLQDAGELDTRDLPQIAVAGLLLARRLATDGGTDGPA